MELQRLELASSAVVAAAVASSLRNSCHTSLADRAAQSLASDNKGFATMTRVHGGHFLPAGRCIGVGDRGLSDPSGRVRMRVTDVGQVELVAGTANAPPVVAAVWPAQPLVPEEASDAWRLCFQLDGNVCLSNADEVFRRSHWQKFVDWPNARCWTPAGLKTKTMSPATDRLVLWRSAYGERLHHHDLCVETDAKDDDVPQQRVCRSGPWHASTFEERARASVTQVQRMTLVGLSMLVFLACVSCFVWGSAGDENTDAKKDTTATKANKYEHASEQQGQAEEEGDEPWASPAAKEMARLIEIGASASSVASEMERLQPFVTTEDDRVRLAHLLHAAGLYDLELRFCRETGLEGHAMEAIICACIARAKVPLANAQRMAGEIGTSKAWEDLGRAAWKFGDLEMAMQAMYRAGSTADWSYLVRDAHMANLPSSPSPRVARATWEAYLGWLAAQPLPLPLGAHAHIRSARAKLTRNTERNESKDAEEEEEEEATAVVANATSSASVDAADEAELWDMLALQPSSE